MGKGEKSRKTFNRKNNAKKSLDVSGMEEVLSDPRFAHIASDPKFHVIPKKQHKIALDSRFSHVFEDERFHSKSALDARGRPCDFSTREDLRRFYSIASDEDSGKSDDESDIEGSSEDEESSSSNDVVHENDSSLTPEDTDQPAKELTLQSKETLSSSDKISPEISEKLADTTCDYARGEALFTDDTSDDDSSTTDEDDTDVEFEWGDLDCDAEWDVDGCNFEETSRFAVCNMDWDRVKAADLMALFASFVPYGGSVTKVTVYPSEFGLKRMAEDEIYGPHELTTSKSTPAEIELRDLKHLERGKLDLKAGATSHHVEAVRRYQRNRMKYYYAVVACDSVGTAAAIYKNCDRHVFEGAGVRLDLRYIPDDMTFVQTPHDVCEVLPENYESKLFFATAVMDSKPTLTWDETDLDRTRILSTTIEKALKKEEFDDEQVKAYLASSSDDDSDVGDYCSKSDLESKDVEETKEARIAKFRALVSEIDEKERKKIAEKNAVSFDEGDFDEKDAKLSYGKNRKGQQEHSFDLTPFEKYLDKREKKKVERLQPKSASVPGRSTDVLGSYESESSRSHDIENEETVAFSDDDVPEDVLEDPYFESLKKRKTKKASKQENKLGQNTEDKEKKEELELMLMNEDMDEERHFSMRDIIRENKIKNMKNKKRKQKLEAKQKGRKKQDSGFKINVDDPRFSALLTSADYNIDPSHPHFKRTGAMDELIQVLQKKRMANHYEELPGQSSHFRQEGETHVVSRLVDRIKSKTKKAKLK